MNVFYMMRLRDVVLSISVLATLCLLIKSLTMKGKFQLESSVFGWSSGPNVRSVSDYFILCPSSICWPRLISCLSFFP
jgi:hypothetical protein